MNLQINFGSYRPSDFDIIRLPPVASAVSYHHHRLHHRHHHTHKHHAIMFEALKLYRGVRINNICTLGL